MEWKECCCSRMISSSPFNLRMMRVREAHAKANPNAFRNPQHTSSESSDYTHGTHKRHRDDSDLKTTITLSSDKERGQGAKQHHVPLSGGNSPPALMQFRKEDGARLNAPSDSVVILDMSDRSETLRDMIVRSRPEWGLYSRTNERW
jgi:hypothetical protein